MMVRAAYKCPLCNRVLLYGNESDIPHEKIPDVLGMAIRNQQFAGNPYLHQVPMHIPCKCPNGDVGLAAFAGFVQVGVAGRPQIRGR